MNFLEKIYKLKLKKRCIVMWIVFQVLLWGIFFIAFFLNKDKWENININKIEQEISIGMCVSSFVRILIMNILIYTIIAAGNLIARINIFTPGTVILLIHAIGLGWLAGINGFSVEFDSLLSANIQFLKVDLWEYTAYILVCCVTMTKSVYILEDYKMRKFEKTSSLKEIKFTKIETKVLAISFAILVTSAIIETTCIFK